MKRQGFTLIELLVVIAVIDDVRIYGRVLTEEEIAWLAGRTKSFDKPF